MGHISKHKSFIVIILGMLCMIKPIVTEGSNSSATQEVFLTIAERVFQPTEQEFSSRTITLSPFMIEKRLYGGNYPFSITVDSLINISQQIHVYPVRIGQELDGSRLFINELWYEKLFNINPDRFILDPKKSKIVDIEFKIPQEITGGFYGGIVFEANPIDKQEDIESIKTGVILAFTLPGELKREGTITDINYFQDKPKEPISILVSCVNIGNVHIKIWGNITIINQLGREMFKIELKPPQVVFPNYSCQLKATWKPQNLSVGTYTVKVNIEVADGKSMEVLNPLIVIAPNELGIIRLEIISFTTTKAIRDKPIYFNLVVFNPGNVHFIPVGEVIIKNSKGEEIATVFFEEKTIQPKSTRILKAILSQGLPVGRYTAYATIQYNGKVKVASHDFVVEDILDVEE